MSSNVGVPQHRFGHHRYPAHVLSQRQYIEERYSVWVEPPLGGSKTTRPSESIEEDEYR